MRKKKSVVSALLSTAVTLATVTSPIAAYERNNNGYSNNPFSSIFDFFGSWNKNKGKGNQGKEESTNTPTDLTLVEDDSTVSEDVELRASTYDAKAADYQVKYFPVTLFDYDKSTINQATAKLESQKTNKNGDRWNGIYFHGMGLGDIVFDSYGTRKAGFHNNWTGDSVSTPYRVNGQTYYENNGNVVFQGLVKDTLDNDMNLQFQDGITDAGIFTNDNTLKEVYTNVGLPFTYDDSGYTADGNNAGYYVFDANDSGAFFIGGAESNKDLSFFYQNPQQHAFDGQDGRKKGWFPFTDTANGDGDKTYRATDSNGKSIYKVNHNNLNNYFFGMKGTFPFSMTKNGKIKETDPKSQDITFDFSGDDDVWVFIDGKLVLDMGGMRNGMNGTMNFAKNTWSISEMKTLDHSKIGALTWNDGKLSEVTTDGLSGTLFNENGKTGILNETRESFAAREDHQLTIFYLERGAGSSNCKIRFNLPMKDNVQVKKTVKSKTEDGTISALTSKQREVVGATNYGFTLYNDSEPVANANYYLLDENGTIVATQSTNDNGHFTLKNGQSAKFIGEIDNDSYYVVEDKPDADYYYDPDFTGRSTDDMNGVSSTGLTSPTISVTGSIEAEDSVYIECINYLKAKLPNPYASPQDDVFVLDYGLATTLSIEDILGNDSISGDDAELTSVTGAKFGSVNLNTEDSTIEYQLTKTLSEPEVLDYTLAVTGKSDDKEQSGDITKSFTGKIYIVPATNMYYEENFPNLITWAGKAGWSAVGTSENLVQESGLKGLVSDSPYGSDTAYLNSTANDSNGTSQYTNTTNDTAGFQYRFSGTGTTFFARTTNNSGYMRVRIFDDNTGKQIYEYFRDTSYKTDDDNLTMYHIPVFSWDNGVYGNYKVQVVIYKGGSAFGSDFWLDGIEINNPLNKDSVNAQVALDAYAADGELNMTFATLRNHLLSRITDENGVMHWEEGFVLFTDTNAEVKDPNEYLNNGPKEEIYLNENQSIEFSLTEWDSSNKVFLGIKSPLGTSRIRINNNELFINNTSDAYYDISSYANRSVDENTGLITVSFDIECLESLTSITTIKVTGSNEFVIIKPNSSVQVEESESETVDETAIEAHNDSEETELKEIDLPSNEDTNSSLAEETDE